MSMSMSMSMSKSMKGSSLLLPFTRKERPPCCRFGGPLTLTLSQGEREQRAEMGAP